jgi:hypothetical protein
MLSGLNSVEWPDRWTNQPEIPISGVPDAQGNAARSLIRQRPNCRIVQTPRTVI